RLHLENTGITDAGLDALKGLERLEYLNLYGTQVSDAGLQKLAGLKNLKKLFVWQTKATDAGAAKLAAAIPGIDINTGWKEPQVQPATLAANTPAPAAPAPAPSAKPA
ncbi:MAG TPA: ribonuclease inhibitor, partial [Bacteroidia bacterium]|nr:ribonuclease inhibitor [Bacteroidia bacterium]